MFDPSRGDTRQTQTGLHTGSSYREAIELQWRRLEGWKAGRLERRPAERGALASSDRDGHARHLGVLDNGPERLADSALFGTAGLAAAGSSTFVGHLDVAAAAALGMHSAVASELRILEVSLHFPGLLVRYDPVCDHTADGDHRHDRSAAVGRLDHRHRLLRAALASLGRSERLPLADHVVLRLVD